MRLNLLFSRFLVWASLMWLAVTDVAHSQPYKWTTIAGSPGQWGYNDGTNGDARFGHIMGITIDRITGDVMVGGGEGWLRRIRHVGTNWVVNTLSLTGPETNHALGAGIAQDAEGNIFMANGPNILKAVLAGTNWGVTIIAGSTAGAADGTNDQARFRGATGLAIDVATNLYVADNSNHAIRKVAPQGTNWVVTTIAGLPGTSGNADGTNSDARFYNPYNLAVDGVGNIFVADTYNATVRKITPIGTNWVVSTIAGKAGDYCHADGFGQDARFCGIGGIAIDRAGRLYVAESCNYTIRKLTPVGTNWLVSTLGGMPGVSGSQDGIGSDARFYPWNVTVDDDGVLYVADEWNYTVRRGEVAMVVRAVASANQLTLSWPNSASNYVLETAERLSDGNSWTPLTNGITNYADDLVLTTSMEAPSAFFRLRKP